MPNNISAGRKLPATPFRESLWVLPECTAPETLQVSSVGITRRDPAYHIVRRENSAAYYVLECILEGSGKLYAAGEVFQPEAGDVYLLPPGMPNEYYTKPENPWKKIWFNVSGKMMDALAEVYRLSGVIYVRRAGLEQEFVRGLEAVQQGRADSEEVLSLTLHRIMYRLARLRGGALPVPPEAQRLKEYLDAHWKERFSLTQLSAVIHRSPTQTIRIFKSAFNTTPKCYHTRRKTAGAVQYLRHTSWTLRAIAGDLGFANEFQFSNWFKLQTGKSPKAYRAEGKKEI